MPSLLKFIARKLLSVGKIRNNFCFLRAFYFCKIKNEMKNFEEVTDETWKNTLDSNKRIVFNKNINLPKKTSLKSVFAVGRSLAGGSTNLLLQAIKKKYNKSELKNLKVLSIGPRAEGEIFNIFAHGFELNNITGLDLFSYSPYIKLGDMHNLEFNNEEFDIVLMGWCLAYSNNKKKALLEVKRVMSKNGLLVIGYSVNKKMTDQDQINKRGYLIRSPYNQINNMENLDDLANSIDLKMFYSKIISTTPPAEKLIYGATK
jgi:SAM-dependent methyltransferase